MSHLYVKYIAAAPMKLSNGRPPEYTMTQKSVTVTSDVSSSESWVPPGAHLNAIQHANVVATVDWCLPER